MDRNSQGNRFLAAEILRSRWKKLFFGAAAVVVFVTTYMLILPALTLDAKCGLEEHTHTDSCYTETTTLICGKEETQGHTHTDACYETVDELICGQEESETHQHTAECYQQTKVLICGQEESEGHTHTAECYQTEKELTCGKIEHTHTDECYDKNEVGDPTADVENESQWTEAFATMAKTGNWREDIVAIANTQLGYQESTKNFVYDTDDEKQGYTRYGAWYGDTYGDWCAMFASFCIHYADVKNYPLAENCQQWITTLSQEEYGYYVPAAQTAPEVGDLIFFDKDKDGSANHVGIVSEVRTDENNQILEIVTIEGNSNYCVKNNTYSPSDETIMGYGKIPENPDLTAEEGEFLLTQTLDDGTIIRVTGYTDALPYPAEEITLTARRLTDEEVQALGEVSVQEADTEEALDEQAESDEPASEETITTETPDTVTDLDTAADQSVDTDADETDDSEEDTSSSTKILYDITLYHNGEEIEPTGSIKVTFENIPEVLSMDQEQQSVSLFHVDTDASVKEEMKFSLGDDKIISMDTDHFSIYEVDISNATDISSASDFAKLANGGTFKLTKNITVTSAVNIAKDTTLDLQGHTVTFSGDAQINVNSGGTFTLIDSKATAESVSAGSGDMFGNVATYDASSKTLTYYVTVAGDTSESLEVHTVTAKGLITTDGTGSKAPVRVNGGTFNFGSGMIAGSKASGVWVTNSGGTVNLDGGYICGNDVSNSTTKAGGGIRALGGTINLTNTVIAANTVTVTKAAYKDNKNGGGIYMNGGTINIYGGVISGNTIDAGDGSRVWDDSIGNAYELTFYGGGGICTYDSTINMSGGYVTNNKFLITNSKYFEGGGGILLDGTSVLNFSGGTISGNYSAGGGGGIKTSRNNAASIVMTGGYLSANHANGAEGGGAAIDRDGVATFTAGHIVDNTYYTVGGTAGDWGGGGLYCADGSAKNEPGKIFVLNAVITDNTAGGFGGGIAGCSTGRIYVCVEEGGAVFGNSAAESAASAHLSGDSSSKSDDHTAANNPVFASNGYQDYFCALTSSVDGGMLGGGTAMWTGSADGEAVSSTSREDVLVASSVMGLTANPSLTDQAAANSAATLFINGNSSYTHGGGILANGYLLVGAPDEINVPARLELSATKAFLDKDGKTADLSSRTFTFEIKNEAGDVVSIGTSDADGNITFDRRLSFTSSTAEGTTSVYTITEKADDSDSSILYDTTIYRLTVGTKKVVLDKLGNTTRYRIEFTSFKLEKKNGEDGTYSDVSEFNTTVENDEQHPIKKALTTSATFTNQEISKINYYVKKVWAGGTSGAASVTVHLYQNGTEYKDALVLNDGNSWQGSWTDLPTKDDNGNAYSYTIKEDSVSGYVISYSYTSEAGKSGGTQEQQTFKAGTFWVPVAAGESLTSGTEYAIVSADYSKALSVSSTHTNTRMDSNDVQGITAKYSGSVTIGGSTYDSWYYGDVFNSESIWKTDAKSGTPNEGAVVFKNSRYDCWLANETNLEVKTTSGGGNQYASRVKLENGYLMMQKGMLNVANSNAYRYVVIGSSGTDVSTSSDNAVHVYKKVTSSSAVTATVNTDSSEAAVATTTATITNTPISSIDFNLNIRKVDANNTQKVLKDAEFNLLDSSGTAMKFTLGSDGYYTPDDNGSTQLLITNTTGFIRIRELPGGTYTLHEAKAPTGYKCADDQVVKLDETTTGTTLTVTVADPEMDYELPKTGGIGTDGFILGGLFLMGTALVSGFYYRRRRERRSEI